MKVRATIELKEDRKAIEDSLIEFWKEKGVDEDGAILLDTIEEEIIGERAVDASRLKRSLSLFDGKSYITFLKDFSNDGALFDVFCELIESNTGSGSKLNVVYWRFYNFGINWERAKKLEKGSGSDFMQMFPAFCCYYGETIRLSFGQLGSSVKGWQSAAVSEDFGRKVHQIVENDSFLKGATVSKFDVKGGSAVAGTIAVDVNFGHSLIGASLKNLQDGIFSHHDGYGESFSIIDTPNKDCLVKRNEIVLRRYSEGALSADRIAFNLGAVRLHKVRAMKDEVIGTIYERLNIPLISGTWKGLSCFAERVFTDGIFLMRIKLGGAASVCESLIKEMEERLGTKISRE